jgi:pimeloyl-ACP methyl ester carboxylesterase
MSKIGEGLGRPIRLESGWVRVGKKRTRYIEAGTGPTFLLIPPAFVGVPMFRGVITALAPHFRVLAAEMPGSGRSEGVAGAWDFDRSADWAAGFLDAVGVERAMVMGHSDGGGVAVLMGARHPDRVDGLVLSGAVGAYPDATWPKQFLGLAMNTICCESDIGPNLFVATMTNLARHPINWWYHVRSGRRP